MTELIPFSTQFLEETEVNTVSARDLHTFLGVGKDFSNWIKDRLDLLGCVENKDFIIFAKKSEKRGRPSKEYFITLDIAKQLAMMEKNDKGTQIRSYFIEVEKSYKKEKESMDVKDNLLLGIMKAEGDVNKALAVNAYEENYVRPLERKVEELTPKGIFFDTLVDTKSSKPIGDVAKLINFKKMGRNNLYKYLREKGVFQKDNIPYQQYMSKGWFEVTEYLYNHPTTGEPQVGVKTTVYQKGIDAIVKMLLKDGYEQLPTEEKDISDDITD